MRRAFFITGTDTGVGKTWATVALMRYFKNLGKSVIAMKPVASGCELIGGNLFNSDALLLLENASIKLPYEVINPYAYKLPVSPHIAGKDNPADLHKINRIYNLYKDEAEIMLVEGAGGWYSPLNAGKNNSDLAILLGIPVILVVGIRLGCINHALLTASAIAADKQDAIGWIASCLDSAGDYELHVIETLKNRLKMPLLGVFPYLESTDFDELAKVICF